MPPPTKSHTKILTPAAELLGRRWLGKDEASGVTRTQFLAQASFANRHGSVHGGFLAAMLDSAAGMAALDLLPPDLTMVTARLDTEFLKPAPLGALDARAQVVLRDERNVVIDAELTAPDGVVVARARATMRIVKRRQKVDPE